MQSSTGQSPVTAPADLVADKMKGIKNIVLVLSGKGGVGKSTVSSQLAFTLAAAGHNVGLLDIDICGPSLPRMLGLMGRQVHRSASGWEPVWLEENLGVMSVGFMLPKQDEAVIWRGPRKNGLIRQFLTDVNWGELDYLLIDTPPGTSDEHISIVQYLRRSPLSGAVVVTTPQEVALMDVRKELSFCAKTGVRVLGVVENMSGFACPECGSITDIFRGDLKAVAPGGSLSGDKPPAAVAAAAVASSGVQSMCERASAPFLGRLPLHAEVSRIGDAGHAVVQRMPGSDIATTWCSVAAAVVKQAGDPESADGLPARVGSKYPKPADSKEASAGHGTAASSAADSPGDKRSRESAAASATGAEVGPAGSSPAALVGVAAGSNEGGKEGSGASALDESALKKRREDVPEDAPEACPGTGSGEAGKASACAGCPNQKLCASGKAKAPDETPKQVATALAGVKNIVLVLSGKGGVGKSTVSSQLAFTLAAAGHNVGLLDIDICGPSLPRMLGLMGRQVHRSASGWEPVWLEENLGVMSVGFMLPKQDEAVIWRGPRKNGLIRQFLTDVNWGELDYLLIDTPPGTSDEHISIVQYLRRSPLSGAVVVTTPQEVALMDVRKELSFCAKTGVRVLGVVENMSGFACPDCKHVTHVFASGEDEAARGAAASMCSAYSTEIVARLPLDPRLGECCEGGESAVEAYPEAGFAKQLLAMAKCVEAPAGAAVGSKASRAPADSSASDGDGPVAESKTD